METNFSKQTRFGFLCIICVLLLQGGCAYYEGISKYTVRGTILDQYRNEPLSGAELAVSGQSFEISKLSEYTNELTPHTNDRGEFVYTFGMYRWGHQKLFNIIPLNSSKGPIPPELLEVVIAVKSKEQTWHMYKIPITHQQQKQVVRGHRSIEVGTVLLQVD